VRLGVDFGTSTTVGLLRRPDGAMTQLLFDSSPLLRSAVFARPDGTLLTGVDAERAAAADPAGLEPNPKRRIDDGTTWLGERELAVVDLVAAVLARQWREAVRVAGGEPDAVVLTHPAAWSRTRLAVLSDAARRAGMPTSVRFVSEPVAAAAYFATILGRDLPPGQALVVYDLGAGTFDVSVVRRSPGGFEVVAADGLADVGGLDLDGSVVDHARSLTASAAQAWGRLDWPEDASDQRARRDLWQGARAAKELLSRHAQADLYVPLVETDLHLTREEFEKAARPLLERTVAMTRNLLRSSGVSRESVAGLFLVGGSSRIPLAATLLHRTLGIAPTVIDQPELVVAHGGLCATADRSPPVVPVPVPPPVRYPAPSPVAVPAPLMAPAPLPINQVLPTNFPVQLVELALTEDTGYTLRVYLNHGGPGKDAPPSAFLTERGRLLLFRRPERAAQYAVGAAGHPLAQRPDWGPLSNAMRTAFLPLTDHNRYAIDLVPLNVQRDPEGVVPSLLIRSAEVVRELVPALELTEAEPLIGEGSLLDRFDNALRLDKARRRRRDLLTFDRPTLARTWWQLLGLIESRVDWRD
jgi:hypothetical protein